MTRALGESGQTPEERAREAKRLAESLLDTTPAMKEHEREFVEKMAERTQEYGEQTFVSPKQLFWLRDLYERYL